MKSEERPKSCVVVGAGIAGLLAARSLQAKGVRVTVLDKGRGVGGRMAMRRIGSAVFDHGAQFFTARSDAFGVLVREWLHTGIAREWCKGFATDAGASERDGHTRYRGDAGMTSVPKYLAQTLDVEMGQRVTSISAGQRDWVVRTDSGAVFESDALILTAPVPQSLAMLERGGGELPMETRHALERCAYDPCIALLVPAEWSHIPAPGGMQLSGEPITWIGDNLQKGISGASAITIHAGPEFTRTCWDSDDLDIAASLLASASEWVTCSPGTAQIHRWRYARAAALHPDSCLAMTAPLPLAFAGDAFGAPRVEGAALSGIAAAEAIICSLQLRRL